jgi:hypothetical protein
MTLKHTDFMQTIAKQIGDYLKPPYEAYQLGETRWYCQVYFGEEPRIHYEVSRASNYIGRQIEVGLHFESRTPKLNLHLLTHMDKHLIQIQHEFGEMVKADVWDRGWTKIYAIYPDEDLTLELAKQMSRQLARFVGVVQPIYETIIQKD